MPKASFYNQNNRNIHGNTQTFVDDVTFIHWKKKKENLESIVKKPLHKMKLKLKSHTRKVKLQKENVYVED